jgi:hypothetical protein
LVAQEHVNDPPFPSLSSYDGIPPNKTYQAAALINAARNTSGLIGEFVPDAGTYVRLRFL